MTWRKGAAPVERVLAVTRADAEESA